MSLKVSKHARTAVPRPAREKRREKAMIKLPPPTLDDWSKTRVKLLLDILFGVVFLLKEMVWAVV